MDGMIHYVLTRPKAENIKPANDYTVGLARAMTYYEHGRLWRNFLTLLGCNVVVSPETNQRILDRGVANCSSETCLPVKVMAGHVLELADKCDAVFIPRYKSTARHEMSCPKLCALPDMMRLNLKNKVGIIGITVDEDKGGEETQKTLVEFSKNVGVPYKAAKEAYLKAVENKFNADVKTRLAQDMEVGTFAPEKTVAVLGHPYMIYDRFLSMNLIGKLRATGLNVITPDTMGHGARIGNAYPYFSERNFYGIGEDNLGCAFACDRRPEVAGIIYLSPFACGIDSLVVEFISRHMKAGREIPMMLLTVDEHTGEAGVDTRIEAFLDMLGDD